MVYANPAIGADGTIYAGAMDSGLYAFEPNGKVKWFYRIGDLSTSSPAIGSDGTIYIGSGERLYGGSPPTGPQGKLLALDQQGKRIWAYPIAGIVESPPAIDASGTVYVGSADGWLYAFGR
jgi:outer membrane protein assembly factor BamB